MEEIIKSMNLVDIVLSGTEEEATIKLAEKLAEAEEIPFGYALELAGRALHEAICG